MSTFDMANLPSDDESDDEDFVPEGVIESDSEVSGPDDYEQEDGDEKKKKRRKKGKNKCEVNPRLAKACDSASNNEDNTDVLAEVREVKKAEREAALWDDFLKDVEPPPRAKSCSVVGSSEEQTKDTEKKKNTIKITKEYDFAGDTVKVEKEVEVDSKEAQNFLKQKEKLNKVCSTSGTESSASSSSTAFPAVKRTGGLSGLVGQLTKKPKMSILDKSKMDWGTFKKQEGIEEDLQTFNRGKDGFLEKQRFLERADVRQFEIERGIREKQRVHRLI